MISFQKDDEQNSSAIQPGSPKPSSTVETNNLDSLRALANPLRLQILANLRSHGPQTVGMLSEQLSVAPGSISYHLSTLTKNGFTVEVPELARSKREHWWQATAQLTTIEPEQLNSDPTLRLAGTALRETIIRRYAEEMLQYLHTETKMSSQWRKASGQGDIATWLSSEELKELSTELENLATKWNNRSRPKDENTELVRFIYSAFPSQ